MITLKIYKKFNSAFIISILGIF